MSAPPAQSHAPSDLSQASTTASEFLAATTDGIVLCDPQGAISFINKAAERILTRCSSELMGRTCQSAELFSSDLVGHVFQRVLRGKGGEKIEYFDTKLERHLEVEVQPLESGGIGLRFRDITASAARLQSLTYEFAELEDFFENGAIGLHLVGPDGTILRANKAELDLLGYRSEEYVGRHIAEFHADQSTINEILICLNRGGTLHSRPARLRCKDGTIKDVLISSNVLWRDGKFIHTRCFTRDVTELKKAERLTQDNAERFRLIHQAACIGAWEWDAASNEVYWSPEYREVYGFDPDESPSFERGIFAVLEDDRLRILDDLQKAFERKGEFKTEHRIKHPTKGVRWITGVGTTVVDQSGTPKRMVGMVIDITERREAEEALKESDRRKDQFLATLSHELRNPLAPIRNGLQLLRAKNLSPETVDNLRCILERQTNNLVRLIDDLLDISRISRGILHLSIEKVDLADVVSRAVETSRPMIEAGHHTLAIDLKVPSLFVNGDVLRLSQVVSNLLNNAAKYTDEGGHIALTLYREECNAVISIADNGIGIAPEMLPRIFDMFVQVPSSGTRTQGGLGIGLSLARSLVEQHGGTLEAKSDGLGKGSEFMMRLSSIESP